MRNALLEVGALAGFLLTAAALPHIKAGKLRGLALTGRSRSPAVPELPTVAEAGVPGYEIVAWQGLFAPSGTPAATVAKIQADMVVVRAEPEVRDGLLVQELETVVSTPESFAGCLKIDLDRWARLVKQAGVRID